ncbi:MAG: DUF1730 domain-containing protein [Candidatus Izemoplasmatales bacterium]|nr:DUF1730 domain-containing protein [Candidatus Izemoplasmatales bacterium]
MNFSDFQERLRFEFSEFGIIKTERYLKEASVLNLAFPDIRYKHMIVVALSYPKRIMKSNKTELYASMYTFGRDYHLVLKEKMAKVMLGFDYEHEFAVDNHPFDERLAAQLAGIGFFGKNQLIINPSYGSFIFLGFIFINLDTENEIINKIDDSCGDCRICIDSCPTKALLNPGYKREKCISDFNQTKKILSETEIKANYCLLGCDICQLVCPKNIGIKSTIHDEFAFSGKEAIKINDLLTLSERQFKEKYENMAYLWKGKTILMRNALTLLLRQKNTDYNDLIKQSIDKHQMPWYKNTAENILSKLNQSKNPQPE